MRSVLLLMLTTTLAVDAAASSDGRLNGLFEEAATDAEDPSREALRRLFDKYGSQDSGRITFEGFEHLLESLGLGHIVIEDHDVQDHKSDDGQFRPLHGDDHIHNEVHSHSDHHDQHGHSHEHHHQHHHRRHERSVDAHPSADNETDISQCLTPVKILRMFHLDVDRPLHISQWDLVHMCPTIVYQLDAHLCHEACHFTSISHHQHCDRHHGLKGANRQTHSNHRSSSASFTDLKVWGSAAVAVTVISLVGLAAVVLIPCMSHGAFYNHLLHFLVAVAIATLTGDALLHLLPHALMPHDHQESRDVKVTSSGDHVDADVEEATTHSEQSAKMVWKGLVALVGIYGFFVTERLISLCRAARRRCDKSGDAGSTEVGQRLSSAQNTGSSVVCKANKTDSHCADNAEEDCLERRALKTKEEVVVEDGQSSDRQCHHQQHQHQHHHHSHNVPSSTSIASAAWMVIMGDGLHNFTDGLAIGAAFANSIAGGLGTTIAVFCHELPHELGDFAVLLRSGMTVKQAIMYNMVSSVLAFIGMCLGIVLATLHWTSSQWVFSLTAGIFIYVSLVDMLPEMTREGGDGCRSSCLGLILDIVGLSLGVIIMTLIAFHEETIQLVIAD